MTQRRLSADLIWLHWIVALLLLLAVGTILSRGELAPGDPWRPMLRQWHMALGMAILLIGLIRLVVRLRRGVPAIRQESMPARSARRVVEWGLYGVVLLQPLIGLAYVQSGGKTVQLLGFQLPTILAEDAATYHLLGEWHQRVGYLFYGLLALHVAAALWHQFVRREPVLAAMIFKHNQDHRFGVGERRRKC
jgi:cytochrome b561